MTEIEKQARKNRLKKEEFNKKLKAVGLTKKKFSEIVGLEQKSVNNWGTVNQQVPVWVNSWLENYETKLKLKELEETIFSILETINPNRMKPISDLELNLSIGREVKYID